MEDEILSERQAAAYLSLSLDDFRHEINQGRIAKRSRRRYRRTDLDDWRRRLPRILAGREPDLNFSGVPRTQRQVERSLRKTVRG